LRYFTVPQHSEQSRQTVLLTGVDIASIVKSTPNNGFVPTLYNSINQWIAEIGPILRIASGINDMGVVIEFKKGIPESALVSPNRPKSTSGMSLW
jgi:hypothetical protein